MVVMNPGVQNPHCSPWRLDERLLDRPRGAVRSGEPLDGGDLVAVHGDREQQAAAHRPAVEQHRAGAADSVLAAHVGAGQAEVVAQRVGQQPSGRHRHRVQRAVHHEAHLVQRFPGHARAPIVATGCGVGEGPHGQHAGQVPPVLGGRMDVTLRVDTGTGQLTGRRPVRHLRALAGDRLGEVQHERHGRHRQVGGPRRGHRPVGLERHGRGHAAQCVVAVPAGHLDERRPGPGRRCGEPGGDRELARLDGGLQRCQEEVGGRHGAPRPQPGQLDRAAEQGQHRSHLAGGVGVGEAADGGPAVADGRVGHQP